MGKLDHLARVMGAHADESMGKGVIPGEWGAASPAPVAPATPARMQGLVKIKNAAEIPLEKIDRDPAQPREEFDEEALTRLAESLKTRGQLQPIRVRWDEGRGVYVVLVGERRWRAAGMAGMATLSCIIVDGELEPAERLAVQLIENCLREDLRPIEQAKAYRSLMDSQGWSVTQLARELAIAQSTATKALALLDLPEPVQQQVEQGALSPATAYEVSKLPNAELQAEVAKAAVSEGLKRSEVADLVQAVKARRPAPAAKPEPVTLDLGECSITIRWKRACEVTPAQALRRGLKQIQEQERARDDEAAA